MITLLRSKLHRAAVTRADKDYEGSLCIDRDLMDAVQMLPYEKILVANIDNGNRFETYAIPAEPGSKEICLNGATAHLGSVGDRVIIFTFATIPEEEAKTHHPKVAVLDEKNEITSSY
jgi:aspartate 1-decarboxylase